MDCEFINYLPYPEDEDEIKKKKKLRGLPGLQDCFYLHSFDIDLDFIDQVNQEPIREIVNRYIQKTKPKVFIVSTKKKNNKNVRKPRQSGEES